MQAVSYLRALPDCSLEVQQRAFLAECATAGLEVGPTFTETASAEPDGTHAPEFRHMLRTLLADQRAFVVVVIADLRVLGESVHEQARRYLQLEALGLPVRLAGGGDVDAAVVAAWSARGGSERRREQVLAGMRERALHGEVLGRAPYGYRVVDRHLRVQPEEAAVVRDIFDRCLAGAGVRVIARALNEAGLRTRRGGAWSMVSVRGVLRNPVYTGTYRRLGVLVPGEHEPLITRERFTDVQERLAERRTSFATQQRGEYLLAGLATCGYCGNHLIGVRRASRARRTDDETRVALTYYQCESRTNQSRCDYHTRHAEELEGAVRAQLAEATSVEAAVTTSAAPATVGVPEAHREGLRRRIDALLERRASGEWSADRLRQEAGALALADLEAEEQAAVASRRQAEGRGDEQRQRAQDAARARLVRLWDVLPFAERRRLLRAVVAAIVVTDEAVSVTLAP